MTILDLHKHTDKETEIMISWDGFAKQLDRDSWLDLDAYGDYSIELFGVRPDRKLEVTIKVQPVREH